MRHVLYFDRPQVDVALEKLVMALSGMTLDGKCPRDVVYTMFGEYIFYRTGKRRGQQLDLGVIEAIQSEALPEQHCILGPYPGFTEYQRSLEILADVFYNAYAFLEQTVRQSLDNVVHRQEEVSEVHWLRPNGATTVVLILITAVADSEEDYFPTVIRF